MEPDQLVGALSLFGFPLWWCFVVWLIGLMSGWQGLARRFEDHRLPPAMQSVGRARLGISKYSGVLRIGASPRGLHLAIMILFRPGHRPLCIPWEQVEDLGVKTLLFLETQQLRLAGGPILKIPVDAWQAVQSQRP